MTAGAAALVIEAFRSTHDGASPSPATVKAILTGTARDLDLPADEQGSGLVDARAAVEAALTYPGASTPAPVTGPAQIVSSPGQTTLIGAPGTQQTAQVEVTNVGTQTQTVSASSRAFPAGGPDDTQRLSIPFNAKHLPAFTDVYGGSRAYKKFTFTVAPGTDRLRARMAYPGVAPQILWLTLLQPDGTFAAYSSPQGPGVPANYANIDVRKPVAGTWTGILTSRAGTGFMGTALVGIASQRAHALGTITPSTFVLAPGQSRMVSYQVPMPAQQQRRRRLLARARHLERPTQRRLDHPPDPPRRQPGQGRPSGVRSLAATPAPARRPRPSASSSTCRRVSGTSTSRSSCSAARRVIVEAVLVDPNGEPADIASNLSINRTGTAVTQELGIQMFDARPIPGRWRLVVVAQNPVSGRMLEQPFTGSIGFDQVVTSAPGLPTSANTVLRAGQPVKVDIRVRNNGGVPHQGPGAKNRGGARPAVGAHHHVHAVRLRPGSGRPPVGRVSDALLRRTPEHPGPDGLGPLDPAGSAGAEALPRAGSRWPVT